MSKPISFKITCPVCEKTTDVIILKHLNKDEHKEELDNLTNNNDMGSLEMTQLFYDVFQNKFQNGKTIDYVIGKIKSHKLGLFDKQCSISNKTFKIILYYFVNHKEKLGGFTFRMGKEIKYSIEMLSTAEEWAKYCTTLNKESISVIIEIFANKKFVLTGDVVDMVELDKDLRSKFQCISADSSMNQNELKQFINTLRDKLEDNGEEVRVVLKNNLFTIECFKNNDWYQCVAVAPKGYSIR